MQNQVNTYNQETLFIMNDNLFMVDNYYDYEHVPLPILQHLRYNESIYRLWKWPEQKFWSLSF